MKILAIVGTKNTGKTTLVTKIVHELVKRSYKVGTLKHTHHDFDLEGKDTWKHREAGAELVVGSGENTFFMIKGGLELEEILKIIVHIKELDYLIIEGFKSSKYPKISTTNAKDDFTIVNVDVFEMSNDDVSSLTDLVEERTYSRISDANCGECGFENCLEMAKTIIKGETSEEECKMKKLREVQLFIGDKMIPLNPFVQDLIKKSVLGMLSSLKTENVELTQDKVELLIRNAED
jgi:molybdopterin-guanine dinucleotide biosynthesis adapter protein